MDLDRDSIATLQNDDKVVGLDRDSILAKLVVSPKGLARYAPE